MKSQLLPVGPAPEAASRPDRRGGGGGGGGGGAPRKRLLKLTGTKMTHSSQLKIESLEAEFILKFSLIYSTGRGRSQLLSFFSPVIILFCIYAS